MSFKNTKNVLLHGYLRRNFKMNVCKKVLLFLIILLNQTLFSQRIDQITSVEYSHLAVDFDTYIGSVLLHENRLFVSAVANVEELLMLEDGSLQRVSSFSVGIQMTPLFIDDTNLYAFYTIDMFAHVAIFDISESPMRHVNTIELGIMNASSAQVLGDYVLLRYVPHGTVKYCKNTWEFLGILTEDFVFTYGSIIMIPMSSSSFLFTDHTTATEANPLGNKLFELDMNIQGLSFVDMKVRDGYLYIITNHHIAVYDISNIWSNEVRKVLSVTNRDIESFVDVIRHEDYLIAHHPGGLLIYDISNINDIAMHRDKRMFLGAMLSPMAISGNKLYVSARTDIRTYDLANDFAVVARYGNPSSNVIFRNGYVIENSQFSSEVKIYSVFKNDSDIITIDTELQPETFLVVDFTVYEDFFLVIITTNEANYFDIYDINTFARINRIPLDYRPMMLNSSGEHIMISVSFPTITRVYRLQNNALSILEVIPGSLASELRYTHQDFLIFLTAQRIEFRSKSNPLQILGHAPRMPGIASRFFQLAENAIIFQRADNAHRIYVFDDELSGFTNTSEIALGAGTVLSFSRGFVALNRFLVSPHHEYFQVEDGSLRMIGEFSAHKVVETTRIFPEHNSLVKMTPGGIHVYDIEFTTLSESEQVVKLQNRIVNVYPNPVRSGDVSFRAEDLEAGAKGSDLEISIFNVRGQLVKRSRDFSAKSGESIFTWNRRNESGREVPSGVYFYRITTGNDAFTGRFLIMR